MQPAVHVNWGAEALWQTLEPLLPGLSIEVLPHVASTNTTLLDRVRRAAAVRPCLLVAEQQTGGRGRLGRSWHSQAGASLTFSLALPLAPADWAGLSLAVGLALADALDPPAADAPPRIGLKWPNDLCLRQETGQARKLGGILIETVSAGAQRVAVVGIGLNLRPLALTDEALGQGQASLSEMPEMTPECSGPQVLACVAKPLLRGLLEFQRKGFAPLVQAYARRDVLRGHSVSTTLPGLPEGRAEGVDDHGALCVRRADGLHRVLSGEVSVRAVPAAQAARA